MNVKSPAASRAVFFHVAVLALSLAVFPMIGQAKSSGPDNFGKFEKSTLVTPQDFIEHADSHNVDIHDLFFALREYEGTKSCLMCHAEEGTQMLDSSHFKWEGKSENIAGMENEIHGKNDLINNFCIAVPTNEGRCTQCHAGYGYKDANYDFTNPENVDCLICHDSSGTYKKNPTAAGLPLPSVDLQVVARSITQGSVPSRKNCIDCHSHAGGGDNVKHGDLSSDIVNTTREYDVHMGTDGANMTCVACHGTNHDPKDGNVNHGVAGMSLHSVHEGEMKQCSDCHGDVKQIHVGSEVEYMLVTENWHDRLACQVCHIPAIARKISTKTEWYWSDAGQDISPIPVDPVTGRPTYDKKKGTFVWSLNVRPTLRYSNGTWERMTVVENDKYDSEPISLAHPLGSYDDPNAMIYPFKLMKGNQVVDPVTKTVSVPHLFGTAGGPNPYWGKFDWNLALMDGAAVTGQDYSGEYTFADTEMLLSVNHEIAPAEQALGKADNCTDCHNPGLIDWAALGWTDDPANGGQRTSNIVPAPSRSNLLGDKVSSAALQ